MHIVNDHAGNPLPAGFPLELANAAFLVCNEAAWRHADVAPVVQWFGSHGYAVLGTELWVIRDGAIHSQPTGVSGKAEVHGNVVKRHDDEPWAAFVIRATAETVAYLRSFKWETARKNHRGKKIYWIESLFR